jgi:lysozyme
MSTRGITDELVAHVKSMEGWRADAYICPGGYPTIGYGHRVKSLDTPSITEEQGEALLREDLAKFRDQAIKLSPVLEFASERRLAAIVDFCYNSGPANYKSSTLKKRIDTTEWEEAATEIQRWVYGGRPKKKLGGLVRRREVVAKWILEG